MSEENASVSNYCPKSKTTKNVLWSSSCHSFFDSFKMSQHPEELQSLSE